MAKTEAKRKIKAIDKRIDAVRRELKRGCQPFDEMSAFAWQRAWDSRPGLQGIDRSLFARRGYWQEIRDAAAAKEAAVAERRQKVAARREQRRLAAAPLHRCEHCGSFYREAV